MAIIDKIKQQSRINIDEVTERLIREFKIEDNEESKILLYDAMYGTLQIILNKTNRDYIIEDMYSLWIDMTIDYWYLNGFDKKYFKPIETDETKQNDNTNIKIKSIKRGDTETSFVENNNETTINGRVYKTGTINYDEDLLLNKYLKRLYGFRLLRRRRRWQ